jgi:type II secretory pathway pseudopilin PulG
MKNNKVKSFTLSEMLVVMIITVIVIGIAFSVLSLVQKQIRSIEKNFSKTTELSLCEQQLWQDFNSHNTIWSDKTKIVLQSDTDTVTYTFNDNFTMRKNDTIRARLAISKIFFEGREVNNSYIDAVSISANAEIPDYSIFVSSRPDAAHYMNQNGF